MTRSVVLVLLGWMLPGCLGDAQADPPAASGPGCLAAACEAPDTPAPHAKRAPNARNILGQPLALCGQDPLTGFYRDGYCQTGPDDVGTHTVCAQMTEAFLAYTLARGNDLITPRPASRFPGLRAGDRWCLCASRWEEARRAGVAPPVIVEASHAATLRHTSAAQLEAARVSGAR